MKPRLAPCVAGRGVTLLRRVFDGAPADCINLGLGQPTDSIPDAVRARGAEVVDTGLAPYGPTAGLTELREAIGSRVYGGAPPEQVLVTTGSQEGLWVTLMALVDRGEEVIVPDPGYPAYQVVTEMIGARPVPLTLRYEDQWRIDVDAIDRLWTDRTRAVVVATPSNPTGMEAADRPTLERLHAMCAERDAWLIADEVYAQLEYGAGRTELWQLGERVVTLSGISKLFSCMGFRVGWIHAPAEVIAGLLPLHQQVALCAPTIGQHLAIACMELWGEDYFAELVGRYAERRTACIEALAAIDGVSFHAPDGAFYVFADVSQYTKDTAALAFRLRDEVKVITAPGESFGSNGAGYLRLSFATDPERVREGIERIGSVLAKLREETSS